MSLQACFNQLSPHVIWSAADWMGWNDRYPHRDGLNRFERCADSLLRVDPLWAMIAKNSRGSLAGWLKAGGDVHRSSIGGAQNWVIALMDTDQDSPHNPWYSHKRHNEWDVVPSEVSLLAQMADSVPPAEGDDWISRSRDKQIWAHRWGWGFALLAAGSSPWDPRGHESVLHRVVRQHHQRFTPSLVEPILAQHPSLLDAPDAHGLTPLMLAVGSGRTAAARWLLAQGATVPQDPWTAAACERWQWLMTRWKEQARTLRGLADWMVLREDLAAAGLPSHPFRAQEIAQFDEMVRHVGRQNRGAPVEIPRIAWPDLAAAEIKHGLGDALLVDPPVTEPIVPRRMRL